MSFQTPETRRSRSIYRTLRMGQKLWGEVIPVGIQKIMISPGKNESLGFLSQRDRHVDVNVPRTGYTVANIKVTSVSLRQSTQRLCMEITQLEACCCCMRRNLERVGHRQIAVRRRLPQAGRKVKG